MSQTIRIFLVLFVCYGFGVINAESSWSKLEARINELEIRGTS